VEIRPINNLQVDVGVSKSTYQIGEKVKYSVRVNQDAHVYLFNVNSRGEILQILPNDYEPRNYLRGGSSYSFPSSSSRYEFVVEGPVGTDQVIAIASLEPLPSSRINEIQRNAAQNRSVTIKPVQNETWVMDSASYRVIAGTSGPAYRQGTLIVESVPPATVYIDGREAGRTPLEIDLEAGRYTIELRARGYQTYRIDREVTSGDETRVRVRLSPTGARPTEEPVRGTAISVRSLPEGATVYVDGRSVGQTPVSVRVSPGSHQIEVRLPGYTTFRTEREVRSGQTVEINARLLRR
jgi:hypothetical protein